MLLFVRQEGCNTLCNVLFDVIVEERVVIAVEAFRPEYLFQELRDCVEVEFGMRQNHTAIDDHLCIRSDITDLRLAGFLIRSERTQVFTGRCIGFVKFPVQRINTDSVREYHYVISIFFYAFLSLSVPADENTCVILAGGALQVRVGFKIVP